MEYDLFSFTPTTFVATWMHIASPPVMIDRFDLEQQSPCENQSGGVAHYKQHTAKYSVIPLNHTKEYLSVTGPRNASEFREQLLGKAHAGRSHPADISISRVHLGTNSLTFILVAVYIHQKSTYSTQEDFLKRSLLEYSNIVPNGDIHIPMIIMGDFNTTNQNRGKLTDFLKKNFNLTLKNNPDESTTLGRSCMDLTFSRHLDLDCKPYASYFSYHGPVFNRIRMYSSKGTPGTSLKESEN